MSRSRVSGSRQPSARRRVGGIQHPNPSTRRGCIGRAQTCEANKRGGGRGGSRKIHAGSHSGARRRPSEWATALCPLLARRPLLSVLALCRTVVRPARTAIAVQPAWQPAVKRRARRGGASRVARPRLAPCPRQRASAPPPPVLRVVTSAVERTNPRSTTGVVTCRCCSGTASFPSPPPPPLRDVAASSRGGCGA